jgi:hypothetical protein
MLLVINVSVLLSVGTPEKMFESNNYTKYFYFFFNLIIYLAICYKLEQ